MIKTLLIWCGLTSTVLAQQFNQVYMRYFSGELAEGIYSYNYFETYNDMHYLSSLISKDLSNYLSENIPTEIGPVMDLIVERDKEWTKEIGLGLYVQIPTPDFAYSELYYLPVWLKDKTQVIGSTSSIDLTEKVSLYLSIEFILKNKKTRFSSIDLSIEKSF
ncbi:TPA: hypothetical protein HA235_05390 [Candidatus Woesearchaeota archaeon]|nr:hypothetical protein [uncultured archaeon]HIH32114.1 hypothetical protein [Candidatus Woesearchaeota archaeon]HIH54887.1 hypothetical protein [Candidatus Woesearchaeota archaeon]HIJ02453.1 hypothetical protein [Candidatus Woesearchaeota archaeon]HIJ13715.1 hypothetical protein [Candidatus Woesearchaeota archaeon]